MKSSIIGTVIAIAIVLGLYVATEPGDTRPANRPSASQSSEPSLPTFKVQ